MLAARLRTSKASKNRVLTWHYALKTSSLTVPIVTAATDLALGIVQRRTESISRQAEMNDIYSAINSPSVVDSTAHPLPPPPLTPAADRYGSLERGARLYFAPAPTPSVNMTAGTGMDIRLDAVLETPIIVLPRTDRSNEVLVGHLGLITIRNETFRGFLVDRTDQVPNISKKKRNSIKTGFFHEKNIYVILPKYCILYILMKFSSSSLHF